MWIRETLLLDPLSVERRITPKTKAIAAVDYAGQRAITSGCGAGPAS